MAPDLPQPGSRRVAVRLTADARRQVRGGHPWVYDASVTDVGHDGACGDLAVVFDDKRRFLAIGLYDPSSPIRIRILHRGEPRPIDDGFWQERLTAALALRHELVASPATTAYRCVHGENDALPGLVIDRYGDNWVVRLDTAAWLPHLAAVLEALAEASDAPPERVVLRLSRTARPGAETMVPSIPDGSVLAGPPLEGSVPFLENGLPFEADLARGQKTGHFLDQRDNRARVGALADGARVLDLFCCTGGFTVHAAAGGAAAVHSIDASPHAIAAVERHLMLSHDRAEVAGCRTTTGVGDAFTLLAGLAERGQRFDLAVVDPPSFASKQADIDRALRAYRRLTGLALDVLVPGGVLVQSSCSSRVGVEDFHGAVLAAAAEAGRPLTEIERTTHPVDHPVGFPQGAYLKTLVARSG